MADDGADDWEDKERLPPIPVGEGAGKDGVGECGARPDPLVLDGKVVLKDLHLILDSLIGVRVEVVAEGVVVAQFKVANLQLSELFESRISAIAFGLICFFASSWPAPHTFHSCKLVWTLTPFCTPVMIATRMMAGSSVIFLTAAVAVFHNLAATVLDLNGNINSFHTYLPSLICSYQLSLKTGLFVYRHFCWLLLS